MVKVGDAIIWTDLAIFLNGLYHYRHSDIYLKIRVLKTIIHVIKDANFQLYRVHPDGVI